VAEHDFSGIQGFESLRAIYGDEVCFHDAEVTRLELIRGRHGTGEVGLRLDIHMFSPIGVDPETRRYRLGNHHVARLLFQGIQDLELGGFNHQNALGDLDVVPLRPPRNGAGWSVSLSPAFGLGATFVCSSGLVESVTAGAPDGSALVSEDRRS
jgi:hypothetical protein